MKSVTQHEIMTSPASWDPSKFDNHSPDTVEQQINQFPSTPQDATDEFYNREGDIIVQKNNSDSVDSNNLDNNSVYKIIKSDSVDNNNLDNNSV